MKESIDKINAHFSMALPIASLLMGITYLWTKKELLFFLSSSLMLLYFLIVVFISLFLFFNYGKKIEVEAEINTLEIAIVSIALIICLFTGQLHFFNTMHR